MIMDKNIINIEYLKTLDWEIIRELEASEGSKYGIKHAIKNNNSKYIYSEYIMYMDICNSYLRIVIRHHYDISKEESKYLPLPPRVDFILDLKYEVGKNKELELFLKEKYIEAYKNALNKLDNEDKELLDKILLKDAL